MSSLTDMGVSIATASFSTALAGALMLPSGVLFYQQFGTFMFLVMVWAWVYSSLFMTSLLSWMGPEDEVGDISFAFAALRKLLAGGKVGVSG